MSTNHPDEGRFTDLVTGNELIRIRASTFAGAMGYCEYIVPMVADGIKAKATEAMKEGSKLHKEREKLEEKEKKFVEATDEEVRELLKIGEQIEFKMEGNTATLKHGNFLYVGRMDKVKGVTRRGFTIEEFKTQSVKTKPKIFDDYIWQAMMYAEMASKNYNLPLTRGKLNFVIKDRITKLEYPTENISINKNLAGNFYKIMKRFEQLYLKTVQPNYHGNPNKCQACKQEYKSNCPVWNNASIKMPEFQGG